MKKYKFLLSFVIYLIIASLFFSVIELMIPINNKFSKVIILVITNSYLFIVNYSNGKRITSNAYKEGIKRSLLYLSVLYFLGSLLNGFNFNLGRIIYYLIIVIIVVLGNILGINKRDKKLI